MTPDQWTMVLRHEGLVHHVAQSLRSFAEAFGVQHTDLVGEGRLILMDAVMKFEPRDNCESTILGKRIRWGLIDYLRKEKVRATEPLNEDLAVHMSLRDSGRNWGEEKMLRHVELRLFCEWLHSLSPENRELAQRYYVDGYELEALAAKFGISTNAVYGRLFRIRQKYLTRLQSRKPRRNRKPLQHGTLTAYRYCRCEQCRRAKRLSNQRQYKKRQQQDGGGSGKQASLLAGHSASDHGRSLPSHAKDDGLDEQLVTVSHYHPL